MIGTGAAILGSAALGLGGSLFAANQASKAGEVQAQAASQGAQAQIQALLMAQGFQRENAERAAAAISGALPNALGALRGPEEDIRHALQYGRDRAFTQLTAGADASLGSIRQGAGNALDAVRTGAGNALEAVRTGATGASGAIREGVGNALSTVRDYSGRASGSFSPYIDTGNKATYTLASLYGLNNGGQSAPNALDIVRNSPDYQFAQTEGMRALESSNAAKGLLRSSGHLRSAQEFGQGLASQQYQNFVNRLSALSGQGLAATGSRANIDMGTGNALAGLYTGQGNALANILAQLGLTSANINQNQGNALGDIYRGQGAAEAGIYTGTNNAIAGLETGYGNSLANYLSGLGLNTANMFTNQGNALAGIWTGQGNAQAGLQGQIGTAASGGITGAGQANAAGIVGGANALNTGLTNVGNNLNQYAQFNALQQFLASRGGVGGTAAVPVASGAWPSGAAAAPNWTPTGVSNLPYWATLA